MSRLRSLLAGVGALAVALFGLGTGTAAAEPGASPNPPATHAVSQPSHYYAPTHNSQPAHYSHHYHSPNYGSAWDGGPPMPMSIHPYPHANGTAGVNPPPGVAPLLPRPITQPSPPPQSLPTPSSLLSPSQIPLVGLLPL
ncbi:hypothetical protein GCM10012275_22860 [Longimycelium tulufanense]|uniref:Uncharacterized protein n=1 Tax=Longimycelium tulufanense TaxID=907463 RepID=A0A8J3CDD7_9PSEU|nr:hypothetical protein [Longimycelium tulufanense]GGM51371.1 hypothetical protein GCM10012275_22860 [Longimycelium tulufanense]